MKAVTNKADRKEVLFQKLGNIWYAFTEVEGQVVYSALPQGIDPKTTKLELYQIIEDHMMRVSKIGQRSIAA